MALTYAEGIYGNAAGVVSPLDHRMAQITEFTKTTTPNLIRSGLLYNGTSTIVTGTAGMSYDVAPFSAVSSRGATHGVVKFANDATANVVTTAAPGSNSRYDVVYAWPRDYAIDGTNSVPVLGVVQGTAAASPTVPSLSAFPGAIELARILVPAGVVATNSGTTITQTAPFTSTDGGEVSFRNATEMNLWLTALNGQVAVDLATGTRYRWSGAAWLDTRVGLVPIVPTSVAGTGVTLGANGEVTASAATTISMMGVGRADFNTIRIMFVGAGTAPADVNLRVRTGGSDISTANYNRLWIETSLSTGPTRSTAVDATSAETVRIDNGAGSGWLEITNLFAATATTWQGASIDAATTHRSVVGRHSLATSYPDLTFIIGTGNFTGKIRVYGYNNN